MYEIAKGHIILKTIWERKNLYGSVSKASVYHCEEDMAVWESGTESGRVIIYLQVCPNDILPPTF